MTASALKLCDNIKKSNIRLDLTDNVVCRIKMENNVSHYFTIEKALNMHT